MSRPLYITVFNVQPAGDPAGRTKYLPGERPPIVKSPLVGSDGGAVGRTGGPPADCTSI